MSSFSDFSIDALLSSSSEVRFRPRSESLSSLPESPASPPEEHHDVFQYHAAALVYGLHRELRHQRQLRDIEAERELLRPPAWSQRQHPHLQQQQQHHVLHPVLRRRYTKHQTDVLAEKYRVSRYVSREEMCELATDTGLTMLQVKIWFQNKRLKERKKREQQQQQQQQKVATTPDEGPMSWAMRKNQGGSSSMSL